MSGWADVRIHLAQELSPGHPAKKMEGFNAKIKYKELLKENKLAERHVKPIKKVTYEITQFNFGC
ncbi:MAG TPA: hypothetical protein VK168_20325 [Saprospiraceae bacterium]|nr:hypothetical protein [Saprospiraceae bacterium]